MADRDDERDGESLTHLDERGRARMVEVGDKAVSGREAVARARVRMAAETLARLRDGRVPKGDVLAVARVAGIQAAKRTPELIPLCHQIMLTGCEVSFEIDEAASCLVVEARARAQDRTGVEMEALTAVSVAALTVYDMLKAVERGMSIEGVSLVEKKGGRSGHYRPSDRR